MTPTRSERLWAALLVFHDTIHLELKQLEKDLRPGQYVCTYRCRSRRWQQWHQHVFLSIRLSFAGIFWDPKNVTTELSQFLILKMSPVSSSELGCYFQHEPFGEWFMRNWNLSTSSAAREKAKVLVLALESSRNWLPYPGPAFHFPAFRNSHFFSNLLFSLGIHFERDQLFSEQGSGAIVCIFRAGIFPVKQKDEKLQIGIWLGGTEENSQTQSCCCSPERLETKMQGGFPETHNETGAKKNLGQAHRELTTNK